MKVIKKVFRLPKPTSSRKRWYYTIECVKCGRVEEKVKTSSSNLEYCTHCCKGGFSTKEYIDKAKKVFADRFDYSYTKYVNKRTKIIIRCKKHDLKFVQNPSEHLCGKGGCPECKREIISNRESLGDVWLQRLSDKFDGAIKLKHADRIGYHDKATFTCAIHGDFINTFGQITHSKYFCPRCYSDLAIQKQSIREHLIGTVCTIYYVYLPEIKLYKLGVTTAGVERRLKDTTYELLWKCCRDYTEAIDIEYYLHLKFLHKRYLGEAKPLSSGNNELYEDNIIPDIQTLIQLIRGLHFREDVSKTI